MSNILTFLPDISLCMSATDIAARLRAYQEKHRLTDQEMAEQLGGFKRTRYANWKAGSPMPASVIEKFEWLEMQSAFEHGESNLRPEAMGKLKVIGSIGAGPEPNHDADQETLWVPIEFASQHFFGFRCNGDSAMPYVHPGDIVVFKFFPELRAGKMFALRDEQTQPLPIMKKAVASSSGWMLRSWNKSYEDIPLDGRQVLGYLVGVVSSDGRIKIGPVDSGIDETFIENELRMRLPT